MKEENLLEMIIKEESWEQLIYNIVSYEGLDPWDVDIIKLTNSFLNYVEKLKTIDFRIPAKVVLVAAILLKLKSKILSPIKGEDTNYYVPDGVTTDEFEQINEELSKLSLKAPIERHVKRKVTLDELVESLRKAMKVKEKKDNIRRKIGKRLRKEIGEEVDIEIRINELVTKIDSLLLKLKTDKVEFSEIVNEWNRNQIVKHFMPMLYLSSMGKIKTEQEKFFKEIFISRKKF